MMGGNGLSLGFGVIVDNVRNDTGLGRTVR